jgi:hypothetical protein
MMSERSLSASKPHDCIVESCEQNFDVTYGLAFRSSDEAPISHLDDNMIVRLFVASAIAATGERSRLLSSFEQRCAVLLGWLEGSLRLANRGRGAAAGATRRLGAMTCPRHSHFDADCTTTVGGYLPSLPLGKSVPARTIRGCAYR